jgi:predicted anti-sigma-YlaC factor YlaD
VKTHRPLFALALSLLVCGCSIRQLAVDQLANAIAAGGTTYSSDEDPELVGAAIPFSLKLMESLLAESPHNRALLTAASSGFTQYSYGWVDNDDANRERAKKLYIRARDYGVRALAESLGSDLRARLTADPQAAVKSAKKSDVPALYWTASAWGLAISKGKDDLDLLADLPVVEALITRAAELDPDYESGAIDAFLMTFEASRGGVSKESAQRAMEHYKLAVERSKGLSASPYVGAAEAFSIPAQNRKEFEEYLAKALAVDPNAKPEWRLQNILARRRAEWLLEHADDLFIEESAPEGH